MSGTLLCQGAATKKKSTPVGCFLIETSDLALVGKDAFQSRHRTLTAEFENPYGGPGEKSGDTHRDAIWNQIYKSTEKSEKVIFKVYCKNTFLSHII